MPKLSRAVDSWNPRKETVPIQIEKDCTVRFLALSFLSRSSAQLRQ
ncbi:hypothetical protein COLO4_29301 [Corchorus olitorius]|uniref:Uncharacterized protein n=1 Tax=Corchorus olitorius TaxID=93759 RepID=A0A1R3HFG5_9ROSI|nr:hypothetical protein COLO4_29301 [Corchorus olitorius]